MHFRVKMVKLFKKKDKILQKLNENTQIGIFNQHEE
jgi:hypothetical protein